MLIIIFTERSQMQIKIPGDKFWIFTVNSTDKCQMFPQNNVFAESLELDLNIQDFCQINFVFFH